MLRCSTQCDATLVDRPTQWRMKNRTKNQQKPSKKCVFFFQLLRPPGLVWPDMAWPYPARPDMVLSISGQAEYGQAISGQTKRGGQRSWKKTHFLEGFCWFFVLFFLLFHRQFVYDRDILKKKKSDLSCFFWPQGPLIQSSAAPQGSPPPTQQINIRNTNQLNWAINYKSPIDGYKV